MTKKEKLTYKAPKLKNFGDFRKLTLTKGVVDKDGGSTGTLRTRASGGSA
jgi:hypothetical protein